MSHSTEWNVDDYKTGSESEEQWKLRRAFMEHWKPEIPEDRLVCLARVFINVEFLGCRYPAPVMRQIAELTKEIAAEFREKKKTKLQRTFVSASDAASDRAKGTKRSHDGSSPNIQPKKTVFVQAQHQDSTSFSKDLSSFNKGSTSFNDESTRYNNDYPRFNSTRFNENSRFNKDSNRSEKHIRRNFHNHTVNTDLIKNQYGNLVLYDRTMNENFVGKLISSCQTCKVKIDFEFENDHNWKSKCKVNNIDIATGVGETQKLAKENSAELSWKYLQKYCYTVKMIQSHVSKDDSKISSQDILSKKSNNELIDKLDVKVESAVASRMMKLMGWKGGSLGATGDGISEPITPNLKQIHRAGLGSLSGGSVAVKSALKRVMQEFKNTGNSDYDLVFANDFTKDERAEMHKLALQFGLKSKSYGRDDERYLVISKHQSPAQLVQSLLDNGGSNDKFILSPPTG